VWLADRSLFDALFSMYDDLHAPAPSACAPLSANPLGIWGNPQALGISAKSQVLCTSATPLGVWGKLQALGISAQPQAAPKSG